MGGLDARRGRGIRADVVMRIFFVPRTTGDIVSFALTALNKAMKKRNLKIGETSKGNKICRPREKYAGRTMDPQAVRLCAF